MITLVLRGMAQRRLRSALTALAILLGVAMIAGTYVLTDTINKSFSEVFEQANAGTDVVVVPAKVDDDGSAAERLVRVVFLVLFVLRPVVPLAGSPGSASPTGTRPRTR
mgnify:CR=1 FL=1